MDKNLTILIAEDDEDDLTLLQLALKKADITNPIHVCRDGEEVLRYLKAEPPYEDRMKHPFPRLLILDLKMPKLNGLEVLRWVRHHPGCSVIPTIVLSTSKHRKDIREAYELGANAYLAKPASLVQLQNIFRNLLSFWSDCELPELDIRTR